MPPQFLVHDSLLGNAIFIRGSSLFERLLRHFTWWRAVVRFLGRFWLRRVPLDANKLEKMGLAQPLGSVGGVDMFSVGRGLCTRIVSSCQNSCFGLDWLALLQHEILPMWQPNMHIHEG